MDTPQSKLDRLADFRAQRDLLEVKRNEMIDTILTPEIRQQLADIQAEFNLKVSAVEENISDLEGQIKQDVLCLGTTQKGAILEAVWVSGRITWDNRNLDAYALEHPEIIRFRKKGDDYVTIRARK